MTDVTGTLEMIRDFGFLRRTTVGDVYVGASQITALGLTHGDMVSGVAVENNRGDGWTLIRVTGRQAGVVAPDRDVLFRRILAALVEYPWPDDAEPTVKEARKLAQRLADVVTKEGA